MMRSGCFALLLSICLPSFGVRAETGILVLAHGSMKSSNRDSRQSEPARHHEPSTVCDDSSPTEWEQAVLNAVQKVSPHVDLPIEVAFGMWETPCFQNGVNRLRDRSGNLDGIVVLPLFISSYSSVIEMQKYIFKIREDAPLRIPVERISFDGKITYLPAIDYDATISKILMNRANTLITHANKAHPSEFGLNPDPSRFELNLVMHGPNDERDNHFWLAMGHRYAADLASLGFAEVHVLSLRDDADEPIRRRGTELLKQDVEGASARGRVALVLPLLLAPGGIEAGIEKRLEGLSYVWKGEAILPDPLLSDYLNRKIRPFGDHQPARD